MVIFGLRKLIFRINIAISSAEFKQLLYSRINFNEIRFVEFVDKMNRFIEKFPLFSRAARSTTNNMAEK